MSTTVNIINSIDIVVIKGILLAMKLSIHPPASLARFTALGALLLLGSLSEARAAVNLLNVSYDPTREFYQDVNQVFSQLWKQSNGIDVIIKQSHGGSGKQARSVIDGLEADVVTLALEYDVQAIAENSRLLARDWRGRLPNNSAPYTSTIVFVVRANNPKQIKDWDDIVKPGVTIVVPNPKTSGGARWAYLAAYGYALKKYDNDPEKAKIFLQKLFRQVPILDTGARGATTTFIQRGIGDVLLSWENEALLALKEGGGGGKFQIVHPSISILAEPSVAWVDKNVQKHGTLRVAEAYLRFLYTDAGQELAAKHYYRPRNAAILAKHQQTFPELKLFTIDELFGGWQKAHKAHFAEGGLFDQLYRPTR